MTGHRETLCYRHVFLRTVQDSELMSLEELGEVPTFLDFVGQVTHAYIWFWLIQNSTSIHDDLIIMPFMFGHMTSSENELRHVLVVIKLHVLVMRVSPFVCTRACPPSPFSHGPRAHYFLLKQTKKSDPIIRIPLFILIFFFTQNETYTTVCGSCSLLGHVHYS